MDVSRDGSRVTNGQRGEREGEGGGLFPGNGEKNRRGGGEMEEGGGEEEFRLTSWKRPSQKKKLRRRSEL